MTSEEIQAEVEQNLKRWRQIFRESAPPEWAALSDSEIMGTDWRVAVQLRQLSATERLIAVLCEISDTLRYHGAVHGGPPPPPQPKRSDTGD